VPQAKIFRRREGRRKIMTRFAKRETCPTSHTLAHYAADALSPLARSATSAHLRSCDFCAAELSLLARDAARGRERAAEPSPAPALPLALRLFAESRLAEINAPSSERIAA
jgi:anti-sigma factor RsiW